MAGTTVDNAASAAGKGVVVYLSMGFGNPYGDPWSPALAGEWALRLHEELGVAHLALSDTVGQADEGMVESVCAQVIAASPEMAVGVHLHGRREAAAPLMEAAWRGGCRRFDGALGGLGGCPMAKDELVGNLPTEILMGAPSGWGGAKKEWNQEALTLAQSLLSGLQ